MKTILGIIFVLFCVNTFAAQTGTLVLKGSVAVDCGIVVNTTANATTLDLINGEVGDTVANVTETCNNANGYTISLSSLNGSKLVKGSLNVPYTVKYDVDSYRALLTTPTVVKTVLNMTSKTVKNSPILITIPASPLLVNGDYTDTITITMVAP